MMRDEIIIALPHCQNPGIGTRWRGNATSPPTPSRSTPVGLLQETGVRAADLGENRKSGVTSDYLTQWFWDADER